MTAVKMPNRDVVNIEPQLPGADQIEKFLFNDIGGTDLINLVRQDTIGTPNFSYSIISDLPSTLQRFDPTFLLTNRAIYDSIFNQFSIKLAQKIPETRYEELNELVPAYSMATNAYFDGDNLVIEFENIKSTEFIQIEIEIDGRIHSVRENDYQ